MFKHGKLEKLVLEILIYVDVWPSMVGCAFHCNHTFKAYNKQDVLDRSNNITKIKILTVIIAVQNQSTKFLTCFVKILDNFYNFNKIQNQSRPMMN